MKLLLKLLALVFITLIILSCDSTEPQTNSTLSLTVEDVSCTEAWLQLKTTNLSLPNNITLFVNDLQYENYLINNSDTLLYIDSLLPNKNYTFKIVSFYNPEDGVNSNKVNTTTLDTTSHSFTWQTFEFGQHSSSVLYDVAIIDENNIWAVGEIFLNDSLGQPDPKPYNSVHWDGVSWEITRIPTKTFSGSTVSSQIRTIFAFNENDIWTFSIAGSYSHWNGNNWVTEFVNDRDGTGSKLWGVSSSNLYLVCTSGGITHYNGTSWRKLESGTDVDIQDIWGITDGINDPFILCAASYVAQLGEHKILRINNTYVDSIKWNTGRRVHSVWFNSREKLYACGGGVFFGAAPSYNWKEQTDVPLFYTERVRGKDKNDLFVVGDFGLLAHYNGITWKTYPEAATAEAYSSLDYKNNMMVTVGLTQTKAVVQFMIRN